MRNCPMMWLPPAVLSPWCAWCRAMAEEEGDALHGIGPEEHLSEVRGAVWSPVWDWTCFWKFRSKARRTAVGAWEREVAAQLAPPVLGEPIG